MIRKSIPFIISLAMFMEAIDSTVLNTAIPQMAKNLLVNPIDLKLALISYLLGLAIFIPISGWLADRFGVKKVFLNALIIFTLSSLGCGFSQNLYQLIFFRFFQGLGGALMMPIGRLIILRIYSNTGYIKIMNKVIMVSSLGMMLGPVLGGFITHYLSWHWIFWINLPIGLIAIALVCFYLPELVKQKISPLDKKGFILFGLSLAGLTFGLSAFSESSIHDLYATIIFAVSLLLLLAFYFSEKKSKYPIINPALLKVPTFRIAILGSFFSRMGFGGLPFLLPLMLQIPLNYSVQMSGIILVPLAIGVFVVKLFSIPILRYLGYKRLLVVNSLLMGVGLMAYALITATTPIYFIMVLTFLYGFFISMQFTAMNSLSYADVDSSRLSAATSVVSTVQQVAQSVGVAVAALLIRLFATSNLSLTLSVFHRVYVTTGLIMLLPIIIFSNLSAKAGANIFAKKQA